MIRYTPGIIDLVPWPFQIERAEAWQTGRSEVILKERQQGFSQVLMAPYILWRMMYFGWACGYWSVDQPAARKEVARIKALYEELPPFLRVPCVFRADDAECTASGGSLIAFPSTPHAGISYTLQLAVMDEAAFHAYGAANFAAISPAVARGQFILNSTAEPELGPAGFFHDMYWASKRGDTGMHAVFEARRRPDRGPDFYAREKARYAGQPERFQAYYPETDAEAFVGKSGLVYPMFSESRHVRAEHPWEWNDSRRKVGGVDWGGGDPTAITLLGMSGDQHIHQFTEFYERGPVSIYEMAAFLSRWPGPGELMCDPSQTVAIETLDVALRGTGWRARKADNRREGMESVAFLLENDRLTIHAGCRDSALRSSLATAGVSRSTRTRRSGTPRIRPLTTTQTPTTRGDTLSRNSWCTCVRCCSSRIPTCAVGLSRPKPYDRRSQRWLKSTSRVVRGSTATSASAMR
jgi:hypothetical protein